MKGTLHFVLLKYLAKIIKILVKQVLMGFNLNRKTIIDDGVGVGWMLTLKQ